MAEETLGKLKIALNLDAEQLDRSLTNVKRSLNVAQAQFKSASAGVDKFNASQEDLENQTKALENVLKDQVTIADKLKKAYEESAKSAGENNAATQRLQAQYLKAEATVKNTAASLDRLNKQLDEQKKAAKEAESGMTKFKNGMDKAQSGAQHMADKMGGLTKTIAGVGAAAAAAAAAGFAALANAALGAAADASSASATVQIRLGKTAEEAERFVNIGRNLYRDGWSESMTNLTTNLTLAHQYLGNLNDIDLGNAVKGAMTLEKSFGVDMNESLRTVGVMMKNYGITADEALDIVAAGFQSGLDSTGEWLDTMREYAPQFAEMGYTGVQAFSKLKAAMDAGAWSLDAVGDLMKEGHIRLQDMSKASQEAYESMGLNAQSYSDRVAKGGDDAALAMKEIFVALQEVESETLKNEYAVTLFGTKYEDLRGKAFEAMMTAKTSTEDVTGAMQEAQRVQEETFGQQKQSVLNQFRDALIPIGTAIMDLALLYLPKIQEALDKFKEKIQDIDWAEVAEKTQAFITETLTPLIQMIMDVVKWFTDLDPSIQKAIGAFVLITAALAPFFTIVATLIPILKVIGLAFAAITLPITGTIAAIVGIGVAIAAIIALIVKHWDEIVAWTKEMFTKIGEDAAEARQKLKDIVMGIVTYFVDKFNEMKEKAVEAFTKLKTGIEEKITNAKEKISEVWNAALKLFNATALFDKGKEVIQGLLDGLMEKWKKVKEWFSEAASFIPDKFKELLGINSPSRVMRELAKWVPEGIAIGLEDNIGSIEKAAQKLTIAATPNMPTGFNQTLSAQQQAAEQQRMNMHSNTYNNQQTFSPTVHIQTASQTTLAKDQMRMMRRLAFQGGLTT